MRHAWRLLLLGLSVVGMSALLGFSKSPEQIQEIRGQENNMYEAKTASGEVPKGERSEHKRWHEPKNQAKAATEPAATPDSENK